MTDDWRRKRYYEPRVLIETERILAPQFPDAIVCLSGAQVEMLRNLTAYLHRRSTWAEGYEETYYLAPDNEDWVTIQSLVAELEGQLMSTMCEDLITVLEGMAASLATMQVCVCNMATQQLQLIARLPDLAGYVDNNDVTYESPSDSMGAFTPPPTDIVKCEYAQSIWYYVFQTYTETLLPFADSTADALTAAIVATVPFAALAGWVGVPVFVLGAIVFALVAWVVSGSITNFVNWLLGTKNEVICILYNNLPNLMQAASEIADFIDDASELSYLDKAVLKSILASEWHYSWIIKDQETNGTWDAYFVTGQCDECGVYPAGCENTVPCNLDDWTLQNPSTMLCIDGYPQVRGGWNRYSAATVTNPAGSSWLKVWWIPRSPSAPNAQADFDIWLMPGDTHVPLYPAPNSPVDVLTSTTYPFSGAVGKIVELSALQYGWYFDVVGYCVYDYDPDA